MDINTFFTHVVNLLNENNIYLQTVYNEKPLKLQSLTKTQGNKLQILFENGVSIIARGIKITRDTVTIPFDLALNALNKFIAKERQVNIKETRPVIITLFSLLSLVSLFGIFTLIKIFYNILRYK